MKRTLQSNSLAPSLRLPAWLLIGAVLFGVIGYSVAIGLMAGASRNLITLLLIALPAGVIGFTVASRYFPFTVLLIPLTALILPFLDLPTGTESKVPISLLLTLLLTGIWLISMFIRGWQLAPSPLNLPLLIFAAICIISLPWGIAWRDPILNLQVMNNYIVTQVGSLATILASLAAPLLIGNFVTKQRQLKYIFSLFIVCGALMTLTQFFRIEQELLNDRGLWGMWFVAPLFGLLIAQPGLHWGWRVSIIGLISWNLYQTVIANSLWISGWAPTFVAMLVIAFIHSWKLCLGMIVGLGALGANAIYQFITTVFQNNVDEGGLERFALWEQNWRVVSEHWLFGTGPAGYAVYYMNFFREDARSTHNNYLDILAQFGFAGLLVWFFFMIVSVREGWRLFHRAPSGFLRTAALVATGGWVGALSSMMLGDWILPFAYNQGIAGYKYTVYSWIFLGMLICIRRLIEAHEQNSSQAGMEQQ
ncbi:MAG: O-antigen ligase family protein [Chloroflexales bacterium]|nr:O-antigen ligase family protein [Chloroflexales bacterium]